MASERIPDCRPRHAVVLSMVLLFVLSACSSRDSTEIAPADDVPTWTLVEELRIGDAGDDDPRKSFSDIRGIVATSSGTIFVLDQSTRDIRVFDSAGNFLRVAARRGAGPGEIKFGNGLAVGAHDSVWVSDPANGRFALYSPTGSYVRQIAISLTLRGDFCPGNVTASGDIVDIRVRVATV